MPSPQPSPPDADDLPLPFPAFTGKGVRIAVIDSGVNPRHPHITSVAGGASVEADGSIVEDSFSDVLGHGTAVMAAIQEKAPDAEYYAVKLFHSTLRTNVDCVLSAIEWAIARKMDIINLSLGTRNANHLARFQEVVAKAMQQSTVLVAAREAEGELCFPGSLAGVYSVGLDWDMPRNRYRCEATPSGPAYITSGYPRTLPGLPKERNLHGISFAVANMSGFIARACQACASTSPTVLQPALAEAASSLAAR